jgi:hypothetical protein
VHRRQILKAIPAMWLAAPAISAAAAREPTIDEMVADLTKRLQDFHGGQWRATQDAKREFVMICRG